MENGGKEKTKQLTAEIGDMKLTMSYISQLAMKIGEL